MKMKTVLKVVIILSIILVLPPAIRGTTRLEWFDVSDSSALCNDFTRAGYFLRRVDTSDRWIIYLESGGLCYSNETCNRRFFVSEVSSRFNRPFTSGADSFEIYYGNFDPAEVWNETVVSGREAAADVVSPLMTSMRCYKNKSDYFPQGLSVQGTDILDQDCEKNPLFCDYNHVVIPYCSSDLWLGSEVDGTRNSTAADTECTQCFDYNEQNGCFRYNPQSENIQFTFRGKIIFMSVIRDLLAMGMNVASEVILAGSSAGGLGALNNAKWLHSELQSVSSAEFSVIFDSAWFINFQGNIYRELDGTISRIESEAQRQNILTLLSILESNEACRDVQLGFPCCSSPFCLLTQTNDAGESYYPKVPTFGIFSLYDVYLLAPSLNGLETIQNKEEISIGYGIDFLLTVGEYGGEINNTVVLTETQTPFFSYYATQCFQHVYLATSTLWGLPGASVFGRSSVELERDLASFNHSIETGVWRTLQLAGATIQEALIQWYNNRTVPVHFRDSCGGPHCNAQCPEKFLLAELDSNNWSLAAKIIIAFFVVCITVICGLLKVKFWIWLHSLNDLQDDYDEKQKRKKKKSDNEKKMLFKRLSGTFRKRRAKVKSSNHESAVGDKWCLSCKDLWYTVPFKDRGKKTEKEESVVRYDYRIKELGEAIKERVRMKRQVSMATNDPAPKTKDILKGITTSFGSTELSAIMGPSGCGKTTLLDLLTGRREREKSKAESDDSGIYIGDHSVEQNWEWYVTNTGYVLQLAAPYYEELTVRENLTFAAIIKLPDLEEDYFEHVSDIMKMTRIEHLADQKVGGTTGSGLSGGQKRRLLLALQMLTLPEIIFLDEPIAGLDSGSASELVSVLRTLAHEPGIVDVVVLTIHRPGQDLLELFDKVVLLYDGKVAYDGKPKDMDETFKGIVNKHVIPLEGHKDYDLIQDVIGHRDMLELITNNNTSSCDPPGQGKPPESDLNGNLVTGQFRRLAALEARASKRAAGLWQFYFPFVFFIYGLILGTVYLQQTNPFLIVSGFAAYSFASSLVMFPMLYRYYIKALEMFRYERWDAVSWTHDLVIQGFCRAISLAALPVVICAGMLYLLLIYAESYDFIVFGQLVIVNLALNQTWTALTIALMCAFPEQAVHLSSIITSIAGFTAGFFIPIKQIPWWYRWISFINPNYYGFSASAFLLLNDFQADCSGTEFECFTSSGEYVLGQFGFESINPYLHILFLLIFTLLFLLLAWISIWCNYNYTSSVKRKIHGVIDRYFLSPLGSCWKCLLSSTDMCWNRFLSSIGTCWKCCLYPWVRCKKYKDVENTDPVQATSPGIRTESDMMPPSPTVPSKTVA